MATNFLPCWEHSGCSGDILSVLVIRVYFADYCSFEVVKKEIHSTLFLIRCDLHVTTVTTTSLESKAVSLKQCCVKGKRRAIASM